jgi:hypothetical protein
MSGDWFIVITSASRPPITAPACFDEPPCDWLTDDIGPALLLPGGPEGRIDVLVQLARNVVGDIQNARLGEGCARCQKSKGGERTTQGFFQAVGHDLLRMFRSVGSSLRVIGQYPKE